LRLILMEDMSGLVLMAEYLFLKAQGGPLSQGRMALSILALIME